MPNSHQSFIEGRRDRIRGGRSHPFLSPRDAIIQTPQSYKYLRVGKTHPQLPA